MTKRLDGSREQQGIKQRVIACRQRLRRRRAQERAYRLSQDEAVLAANELLALVERGSMGADAEEIFDEERASTWVATPGLTPEVDRRARLRAR